jgi:hypothetical protein
MIWDVQTLELLPYCPIRQVKETLTKWLRWQIASVLLRVLHFIRLTYLFSVSLVA